MREGSSAAKDFAMSRDEELTVVCRTSPVNRGQPLVCKMLSCSCGASEFGIKRNQGTWIRIALPLSQSIFQVRKEVRISVRFSEISVAAIGGDHI